MSGNAGNINNAAAAILTHDRDHRLHASDSAKEIGLKQFAQRRSFHLSHRVADADARIINPDIHAMKVLHRERKRAVNLIALANITSQSKRTLRVANSLPSSLSAARITRKQHHASARIHKNLGNGLPNSHGSPR